MFITKFYDYIIHVVEVNDRWAYIIEQSKQALWDGHVSDPEFHDRNQALAAGIQYIKSICGAGD